MKQKDIILIAIIIVFAAIASFIISGMIFNSPQKRQQQVEQVQVITAEFPQPDKRFFNETAFDPTRTIVIGQNANPDPFSAQQQ